jgi:peptide/nickel transport system ATP-binding protein
MIVFDEPTTALDVTAKVELFPPFRTAACGFDAAAIRLAHHTTSDKTFTDGMAVTHRRRIVKQGVKDEVLSPAHPGYAPVPLSSVPEMDPDRLTRRAAARGVA